MEGWGGLGRKGVRRGGEERGEEGSGGERRERMNGESNEERARE